MILVAFNHTDCAVEMSVGPVGVFGEAFIAVAHAMAFNVRFVDQIKALTVTEIIPRGLIRIMRRADGVDVVLLHHKDVPDHAFDGDGPAEIRINLVAVHPLDQDALTVDEQIALLDLNLAEAHVEGDDFERLPLQQVLLLDPKTFQLTKENQGILGVFTPYTTSWLEAFYPGDIMKRAPSGCYYGEEYTYVRRLTTDEGWDLQCACGGTMEEMMRGTK